MIILDTNVVAEMMRASPAREVVSWLNEQDAAALFLTAITIGEIGYGLEMLPHGARRLQLGQGFARVIAEAFAGRILVFDEEAARHYGVVMGRRKEIGRPLSVPHGQIAAIARAKGSAVATRNVGDFDECGVEIVNPFEPFSRSS